jgi:hypothetical protein
MRLLPSQVIIVAAILLFGLYAFRLRNLVRDRVIFAALVLGGIVLAIYPDLSTRIANRLGVGRGTDLLLYVFLLFSLFYNVHVASHWRKVNRRITDIVRQQAIETAQQGPQS